MTVTCPRRLAGAASTALSTSACEAPGSSGAGAGAAPRPPCADTPIASNSTPITTETKRFMVVLQY
jgi:hypothetical protein